MTNRLTWLGAASMVFTAACAGPPQEPIVSGFNGDSVTIIQPAFAAFSDDQLAARALDICRRGDSRRTAERVSARPLPDFQGTEYLFLCLD
jgi:hypothetical protein